MRSPSVTNSLSLANPGLAFCDVTQYAMFFMSASDKIEAKPCMIGLARLPALNSCNCLIRYSGCCCASLGLAGMAELPSALWQAAHTAVNLAWPWARSGLAAADAAAGAASVGFSSAAKTDAAGIARQAAVMRQASNFIFGGCSLAQKPVILQCAPGLPRTAKGAS